jgi:hypothetical protein
MQLHCPTDEIACGMELEYQCGWLCCFGMGRLFKTLVLVRSRTLCHLEHSTNRNEHFARRQHLLRGGVSVFRL